MALHEEKVKPEPKDPGRRILNWPLSRLPPRLLANRVAKQYLRDCYDTAKDRAETQLLKLQCRENMKMLSGKDIRTWRDPNRPDFVMLRHGISGNVALVTLECSGVKHAGLLTHADLHRQIRRHIEAGGLLEKKHSVRIARDKPWLDYLQGTIPACDVPCDQRSCAHLLGTNLIYYTYC